MELTSACEALRGRRVLVTGASGFIGGRLVERLVLDCRAEVRVLVRNLAGAVRLSRFALDFRRGDVTDRAAVAAAARDCDVIFHCAYGTSGSQRHRARVNRLGTRCVLEAAQQAGSRRVVHLSTLMVYGRTADGDLDESAPRRRFGDAYSDSKLAAERLALDFARSGRAPVVMLQPTAVFGPWGGVWTRRVLDILVGSRMILVDGGDGLANFVYVDDLTNAMLLAASADDVVGEAFLVSSAEPVTWREWYERFASMLPAGPARTVEMSTDEARALWRATQRRRPRLAGELLRLVKSDRAVRERLFETRELRALREAASATLPESTQQRLKARLGMGPRPPLSPVGAVVELPVHPLSPDEIAFHQPRTRVRIDRAQRLLGYRPAFDLEQGMALTERWARWAGLLQGA